MKSMRFQNNLQFPLCTPSVDMHLEHLLHVPVAPRKAVSPFQVISQLGSSFCSSTAGADRRSRANGLRHTTAARLKLTLISLRHVGLRRINITQTPSPGSASIRYRKQMRDYKSCLIHMDGTTPAVSGRSRHSCIHVSQRTKSNVPLCSSGANYTEGSEGGGP